MNKKRKRLEKQIKKLKDNLKKMNEHTIKLPAPDISGELAAFMRGIMAGIRIGHG